MGILQDDLINEIDIGLSNDVPKVGADGVEALLKDANGYLSEFKTPTMTQDFTGIGTILAITHDGQVVVYKTTGKLPNYVGLPYGEVYEQLVQRLFDKQDFLNHQRELQKARPAEDGEARRLDGKVIGLAQKAIGYTTDLLKQLVELRKPYQTRGL